MTWQTSLRFVSDCCILFLRIMGAILLDLIELVVPPKKKFLKDQVILITGAGGALGREMAVQLSGLGARLILADIDEVTLKESGTAVREAGGEAVLYRCDVASDSSVADLREKIRLQVGQVQVVIHGAGIYYHKPLLEHSRQELERTLDINTLGTMAITQAFLGEMISSNSGHMVFISSILGVTGREMLAPYCASKFAVSGFADALTQELTSLGADGVHVTTIHPFIIANITDVTVDIRVPSIFRILSVKEAATTIIDAFRRNTADIFLPTQLKLFMRVNKLLPRKVRRVLKNFIERKAK